MVIIIFAEGVSALIRQLIDVLRMAGFFCGGRAGALTAVDRHNWESYAEDPDVDELVRV
jgi:hypothetical protein